MIRPFFAQLREDVQAVLERDPAARNTLEVVLTYPGIHALVLHRLAHQLWTHEARGTARGLSALGRFLTGIEIHPAARIGRRLFIDHGMGVVIGETAEIGDDVTLYHGVTLGGTSLQVGKRHPTLEDGVVVGAGAKILGAFTVGKNAKIGSNSVVTKPVPPGVTAIGNPARYLHPRAAQAQASERKARFGFMPYAAATDLPDPVIESFELVLDQLHQHEQRMDTMCKTLCQAHPEFCDQRNTPLHAEDLPIVEDHP